MPGCCSPKGFGCAFSPRAISRLALFVFSSSQIVHQGLHVLQSRPHLRLSFRCLALTPCSLGISLRVFSAQLPFHPGFAKLADTCHMCRMLLCFPFGPALDVLRVFPVRVTTLLRSCSCASPPMHYNTYVHTLAVALLRLHRSTVSSWLGHT